MQLFRERQERGVSSEETPPSSHKPSISKIRQQYEENLRLTKEEYTLSVKKIEQKYSVVFDHLYSTLGGLSDKLIKLEGGERSKLEEKQPSH